MGNMPVKKNNIESRTKNMDKSKLKAENKHLHQENRRLARQAEDVALANAHAAELMVQLEEVNEHLEAEIEKRKEAEQKLQKLNREIETKVQKRTAELTVANERLTDEINKRELVEHNLREHKQRLDIILSTLLTGVVIVDGQTHEIVDVNPLAAKIIGLPKEQIIGKVCHEFICPAEEGKCPISDLGQTVDNSERMLLRPNGEDVPILKNVSKAFWQGREYLIESFIDITESKRVEKEMKEINAKLADSNKQLQEFIYVASHDLKEPLRKVSAFGGMLKDALKGKLDDDELENFDFMFEGTGRMQELVDSLLAYSKIMIRDTVLKDVDLNVALEHLKRQELSSWIEQTQGTLRVPDVLPMVQCDPTQIKLLLLNLIKNALVYHRENVPPIVTIRACCRQGGYIKIGIEDNGIGIKREQLENIFAMFKRMHSRQKYEGAGIGLTLCKRIVEKHKGEIGVISTYDQGSTFWFTLPVLKTLMKKRKKLLSNCSATCP
jgi:PAS domain S-box-containing protein